MREGILLSGPPASGKDSVTSALHRLDPRLVLFPRLKAGTGRMAGYRPISFEALDRMVSERRIIQSHERYGNRYAVDREYLYALLAEGKHPVIHVGRMHNLESFRALRPTFLSVLLWASRDVVAKRLNLRGDDLLEERLDAWEVECADIARASGGDAFDIAIDTGAASIDESADAIMRAMRAEHTPSNMDPAVLLERIRLCTGS
jgi:guanylate kinase